MEEARADPRPYYELMREAVESFAQRWGGLDDSIFLRVLEEGRGRDRLAAIFAIGHSSLPQAEKVLAPFLQSANRMERCAAACVLGLRRDERALPVLKDYLLQDALDENGRFIPEARSWYNDYRCYIARVLASWGPSSMTWVLRRAFLKL